MGIHQVDVGDAIDAADRTWIQQALETRRKPLPGDTVVMGEVPHGLLDGLPLEDQHAIRAIVGKPIRLNEYDDEGRAELEFTDSDGSIHFVYVSPDVISTARKR